MSRRKLSTEEFIERSNKIHNYKYDYSITNYVNSKTKVDILCKEHGVFTLTPADHLRGSPRNTNGIIGCGCPKCGEISRIKSRRKTQSQYIEQAKSIHGELYDYSNLVYVNSTTPLQIICKKHGVFLQRPEVHLNGLGCPKCSNNLSKGEKQIIDILDSYNINYETQKRFKDLYYTNPRAKLRFDFYLPDYNILLEYHGEQHYLPINIKGRINNEAIQHQLLYKTHIKDKIKEDYAESSGFLYEIIKYDDDIRTRLAEILGFHRG